MKTLKIDEYEFLSENISDKIQVVFSTAKNGLSFNKREESGISNLNNLKEWFNVSDVIYLNQVHGKTVYCYDGSEDIVDADGDGSITNKNDVLLGVFTADCVPVILVDDVLNVVAAIHSGWKGTYADISGEGVRKMVNVYGSRPENIKAYIGPHNRVCCYEVSEELIDKFKSNDIFRDTKISEGRHLDLKSCIFKELTNEGIKEENIFDINLCTYCSKEQELFSYRHPEQKLGRLFSFVVIHK